MIVYRRIDTPRCLRIWRMRSIVKWNSSPTDLRVRPEEYAASIQAFLSYRNP